VTRQSAQRPRWTVTALTLPQRETYLRRLIESINAAAPKDGAEILIVYNARTSENPFDIETRIQRYSRDLPVSVHVNGREPTIAAGRNLQLTLCKSPLVCFVDDDITIHGDIFPAIEDAMRSLPVGLVGLPSYNADTDERVKPRPTSPSVDHAGMRFMQVQGMLGAGYRDLLLDVGGFNTRRRFWGEWTELNTRLWRNGFPTGYVMDAGYLRHWEDAPQSPTRNMAGREAHVLWGLICTALEYDAVDSREATGTFWQLVEQRYLAYSFGDTLSLQQLLRTTLELMPRISAEWSQIATFKEEVARHPFSFMPFHPLSRDDVLSVLDYAEEAIVPYRVSLPKELSHPASQTYERSMAFRLGQTLSRVQRTMHSMLKRARPSLNDSMARAL
jgi:hypothetical protein